MKLIIELTVDPSDDDRLDPEHDTGLTEDGYESLFERLMGWGDDMDTRLEP